MKRRWWIRVPLFAMWAGFVCVLGWTFTATHPTFSLGRELDGLAENEQIAILAMIDQMKTNHHIPNGDALAVNGIGYRRGIPDNVCGDQPAKERLTPAILSAAHALGYEGDAIRCHPDVGYFFRIEDPSGRILAGYRCEGWCGSGNVYTVSRIGSVIVLWRTGMVAF